MLMAKRYRRTGGAPALRLLWLCGSDLGADPRHDLRTSRAGLALGRAAAVRLAGWLAALRPAIAPGGSDACFESGQATDQRHVERLIDVIDLVEVQRLGEVRGDVLHVGRVLGRVHDVLDARALGAEHLLLE